MEIRLPAVQAGSSIMPGKVNPVIPEVVNQVAFQVIGNDLTVTMAAEAGQLQLNAFEPVIVLNVLQSMRILMHAMDTLATRCVAGIEANVERCEGALENSLVLATMLVPHIGYARAATVAKTALAEGAGVAETAVRLGFASAEEVQAGAWRHPPFPPAGFPCMPPRWPEDPMAAQSGSARQGGDEAVWLFTWRAGPASGTYMNDLAMPGPLKAALADKGYDTLTPVQEAVLAEGLAGRDLLVSAQTGSGKTVAFGLAIAPEVLGGIDALLPADKPLALIVAPTRELAQQVARELEWLYATAGAQLATCVGGMDYRTERRALDRGAHIVVGTPGRLRDHIERGSLDLSGAARRGAGRGRRDAGPGLCRGSGIHPGVRPRGSAHADVLGHRAERDRGAGPHLPARCRARGGAGRGPAACRHRISGADRAGARPEHAIFNVLRFHEALTAIVFARPAPT
jgi:hypothetical protein